MVDERPNRKYEPASRKLTTRQRTYVGIVVWCWLILIAAFVHFVVSTFPQQPDFTQADGTDNN